MLSLRTEGLCVSETPLAGFHFEEDYLYLEWRAACEGGARPELLICVMLCCPLPVLPCA